jgi:hypothetical protein
MKRSSQRDIMRELHRKHGGREDQVVRAYAEAERHGLAPRASNVHGLDAKSYARALFNDGVKKGWLR